MPGGDFDDAWARHERRMLGDVPVRLVDRATLRALKLASGRPKDLEDAEYLRDA